MATQHKRAWKLQEFVAHGSKVTCLALSPATGRVMVTGGEDRKVNLWAIGKPNIILSLSGHTSTVESVKFNATEDTVVAGSQSGTLKIWDLEASKIIRTLTGHQTSVKCMDFHPFGDFVASGSLGTFVKLWDIRRKGCIFTYKGHTDAVNNVKFSPDGRWIISSGEDGSAKLWDLTTGKLVNDFKAHTGAVNAADFHPREFFLATASSDRTIKFWDLESFQLVSSTPEESTAIRCIGFHDDGACIFSGSQDSLRVYGWEPVTCFDKFPPQWGNVADIAFSSEQMIGGSFHQTNVSVWVVDLSKLRNNIAWHKGAIGKYENIVGQLNSAASAGNDVRVQQDPLNKSPPRRAFNTERPPTTSSKPRSSRLQAEKPDVVIPAEEQMASEEGKSKQTIFTARNKLGRTPPTKHKPFPAPLEDQQAPAPAPIPAAEPTPAAAPIRAAAPTPAPPQPVCEPVKLAPEPVKPVKPVKTSKTASETKKIVPSERAKPADLQMSDFLPKPKSSTAAEPAQNKFDVELNVKHQQPQMSEDEAFSMLTKSHSSICAIMTSRQKNLNIVSRYWADGEIKTAVQVCVNMDDQAIMVDLLNVLILKQALWNLDVCSSLLPQIKDLISSKYESYVQAGASAVKLILRNFAPVIKSNMAAPPASIGVDIVREERYKKCQKCHSLLMAVRQVLSSKTSMTGKMGSLFREMSLAFAALD